MESGLMKDRRKYERFVLRLRGKMRVVASGNVKILDAVTSDISTGGAFLHTIQPLPAGTRVNLELVLASKGLKAITGTQGSVRVAGTVVRSSFEGTAIRFGKEQELVRASAM